MIVTLLLEVLYGAFNVLTLPINIPPMPEEAMTYVEQFFEYLEMGAGILANYTPFAYLMILFGVLLAVDIGIMVYHFVLWILKKIPVLGIS
jgi:hypothetical protein